MAAIPSPRRRSLSAALLGLVAAGALAGCGGSGHHSTTGPSTSTGPARKPSVAAGTKGLPKAAAHLFASDGSAPAGHDDTVTQGGSVIASSGFNPSRDGFSFQNYGFIAGVQLTPTVLQQMFGASVCAHGSGASCALYPAVAQWAAAMEQGMIGGHCYGFSMLALRFFSHNLNPRSYGAATTYGLQFTPAIESEIAANFAEQGTIGPARAARPVEPSEAIKLLTAALKSRSGPFYTLGIYNGPPGTQGRDGHAITPIAISNLGGGRYQILVYDNNYPGDTRGVDIDTNAQTWSYATQTDPESGQPVDWSGKGTSNELNLIPVSAVEQHQNFSTATGAGEGVDTIALGGDPDRHAHLLITAAGGRKLGFEQGRFVNQIPGARVIYPFANEVSLAHPEPIYLVPGDRPLSVKVAGGDPTGSATAKVLVAGPGFGTTISNLVPSTASQESVQIASGGSHVSLTLTGARPAMTPTVQLARDQASGGSTVTVAPSSLSTGNTLTVGLHAATHQVSLAGSQSTAPAQVTLHVVTPHGTHTTVHSHVPIGSGGSGR
jgi:hypothetical protein